ncbi:MAG: hypothetical protein QW165_03305 [Candidatus Woesearchaeota archaeon]
MKWVVAFIVLVVASVACVQIVDYAQNETVYKPEVVQSIKADLQKKTEILPTPTEEAIQNETNFSNSITGSVVEEVFEDLTIAQAHKMIPELEAAVRNASCYNLTWNGLSEQKLPLEVKKEMRFNYMGGRLFKGWIVSRLSLKNDLVDAQTVEVLVEWMQVTCLDTENFTIDWDAKLKRLSNNI